ncbi:MAG: ankyrin repeat domain-containing protein, partial [Chloroflexota bacterium]|nr:ankyrin repeat domain-containing protein [Chloroflexota bacterium]
MTSDDATRATFFSAIERGERDEVTRLLAADPALADARTPAGVSATLHSLYYGEPEIAAQLADAGATLTVFEAAALGRVETLAALLAAHPAQANAVASDGFSPLGLAAFFGQPETARLLLDHGANPNTPSANAMRVAPLHSAVAAQRLDIAEALLARGAQV